MDQVDQNEMSQDQASSLWQEAIALRGSGKKPKIKKAIQLAERIIAERVNPPDIQGTLHCFIGDCYHIDLQKHDRAMDYYQKASEITGDPWAFVMVGDILLHHKKDYQAAADVLQGALARGGLKPLARDIAQDYLAEARKALER